MLRKKVWVAAVVTGVLVGGTQPVLLAQDTSAIRAADRQRDEMFRREAARIEAMPEGTPAERTAKLAAINQLMSQWEQAKRQTSGMLSAVENATNGTNNNNRTNGNNSQPSFLSKLADTALNIGGQVIGSLLQKWLNGGLSNEERSTLDRLMSERDAATNAGAGNPDSAAGRPIYDSNGNIVGWDRDGDNKADFGADENGNPTDWNGGSYKDGYDYSDPSTLAAAPTDPNAPASPTTPSPGAPNGRVSMGSNTGPGASGGADEAAEGDEEGKDKDDKDKDEKDEEGKDKDEKDKDGKAKTDKDGKKRPTTGAPDTRELVSGTGKVIVLVKPDVLAGGLGLQGNTRPGTGAAAPGGKKPAGKDGGWNYQDDWADSADNGDYDESWDEEWGNGWGDQPSGKTPGKAPGQPARPGRTQPGVGQPGVAGQPGAQPVPLGGGARPLTEPNLLHELGQIDTQITEWRKAERERLLREKDPYAFGNKDNLQGNYGQTKQEDPFAAYRTLEGRLDLTKVDVWLVIDESWLEGKEPRRYRLRATDESVDQFDPVHGEYMVVQGTVVDLPVDPLVLQEIKGEVKEMEVVKVVAKSKTPPARDGTLDPLGVPGKTPAPGF